MRVQNELKRQQLVWNRQEQVKQIRNNFLNQHEQEQKRIAKRLKLKA